MLRVILAVFVIMMAVLAKEPPTFNYPYYVTFE